MKKQFKGVVISDKMEKSCVVKVTRLWQHPVYKKRMRRSKKYHAHNETGAKTGDEVVIEETRPMSKTKQWKIVKILSTKS